MDLRIQKAGKKVTQEHLINKLNQAHFMNRPISINFIHPGTQDLTHVRALPQPCLGEDLVCTMSNGGPREAPITRGTFHSISLEDKDSLIVFWPVLTGGNESELTFKLLPEIMAVNSRSSKRYSCEDVTVGLSHGKRVFNGRLIDMSGSALSVALTPPDFNENGAFHENAILEMTLFSEDTKIYEGACRVLRKEKNVGEISLVMMPTKTQACYMEGKVHRSNRVKLIPLPEARFSHPLIHRHTALKIDEISGTGFSVVERGTQCVLFPGMELPDVEVHLAPGFSISCKAQVVHCTDDEKGHKRSCGLAFTHMESGDHQRLVAHLQQARNPWAYVSCHVEPEDVWDLFFNSGFVYPEKYAAFHPYKEAINSLYKKIYNNRSLKFSKNLIYKENGIVKGHIGLVRTFSKTWLMHHMAGKGVGSEMPGIAILNQVGSFINDSYGMESNAMKYATTYFRPDNKVPNLLFGGVARSAKDKKICSMDTFAYFHHPRTVQKGITLEEAGLRPTTDEDLLELADFNEQRSGGLMVDALDLRPENRGADRLLGDLYSEEGCYRERTLYSLKKGGRLKAVLMDYKSDIGLNLSDLTNGLHVWVVDPGGVTPDEFKDALSLVSASFEQPFVAVTLYPRKAAERFSISHEKEYTLWIMEMRYSDHYFSHLKKISRFFKN
jgi:c-di-GMP-binding flagellar brake protein YcgR